MAEYTYFWPPYDATETGALASWLNNLAEQGYRLVSISCRLHGINCGRFKFEKTSTGKMRYCIYPIQDSAYCSELGWAYVDAVSRNLGVYSSTADSDAMELDCESSSMKFVLKKENRRRLVFVAACFLYAVVLAILYYNMCIEFGGLISLQIGIGIPFLISMLVALLGAVGLGILQAIEYFKRRKKHDLFIKRQAQAVVKSRPLLKGCLLLMVVAGVVTIYISNITYGNMSETIPLSQYEGALSFPLLEQISLEEWATIKDTPETFPEKHEIVSFVFNRDCFVAPKILSLRQHHYAKDVGTDRRFWYNVDYYEMRTENLAVQYEKELLGYRGPHDAKTISVDGYESAFYYLDEDGENLILRRGNIVMSVLYYGSGSLLDSVDLY